jgi:hypothetical protein
MLAQQKLTRSKARQLAERGQLQWPTGTPLKMPCVSTAPTFLDVHFNEDDDQDDIEWIPSADVQGNLVLLCSDQYVQVMKVTMMERQTHSSVRPDHTHIVVAAVRRRPQIHPVLYME